MTITDVALDSPATTATRPAADPSRVGQKPRSILPDLIRSEWAKIRTVRSTCWCLIVAVAAMIGIGAIISAVEAGVHKGTFDPVSASLGGVLLAQLAVGVLGVLIITSEYSTGMIRSTFVAAPQRGSVIAAKAIVFGGVALVVGTVASFITFFAGQAILGPRGVNVAAPGALRSVIGVGLYLAILGVFAVGLGTIIRNSAGAIAALFGLLLVLPAVLSALPTSIQNDVEKFLPGNAGQAIFNNVNGTSSLSPWLGLGVFAIYAAVTLGLGLVLVRRRDA